MQEQNFDPQQSVDTNHQASPVTPQKLQASPYQTKEGKKGTIRAKQRPIQAKQRPIQTKKRPVQKNTRKADSLPSGLLGKETQVKANVGALTGVDVSDAQIHYNSNKPAQLKAEAYAQGNDVHLASGKEAHLGHELVHVAQQKQGRVQPTIQGNNGIGINNDPKLEQEADHIGAQAMQMKTMSTSKPLQKLSSPSSSAQLVAQCVLKKDVLNVVGENHTESEGDIQMKLRGITTKKSRRGVERTYCKKKATGGYWQEMQFRAADTPVGQSANEAKIPFADPFVGRFDQALTFFEDSLLTLRDENKDDTKKTAALKTIRNFSGHLSAMLTRIEKDKDGFELSDLEKGKYKSFEESIEYIRENIYKVRIYLFEGKHSYAKEYQKFQENLEQLIAFGRLDQKYAYPSQSNLSPEELNKEMMDQVTLERSEEMHQVANERHQTKGVWKIGEHHVEDIKKLKRPTQYNLVTLDEFNAEFNAKYPQPKKGRK